MSSVYLWFELSHNSKFYLAVYTSINFKNVPKCGIFFPNSSQGLFPKMAGKGPVPFVIKIFVLSIFEWLIRTGFTVPA